MVLAKILASYTFRFALAAVVVLSMVVMFVMVIVYGVFSYNYFHEVHQGLSNELAEFTRAYESAGLDGASEFIVERDGQFNTARFAYMVVDADHNKLIGDLDDWPEFRQYGDGWLSFEQGILLGGGDSEDHDFVARSHQMPDGNQLLVARSYEIVLGYIRFVVGILLRGFIVTVSMGAFGAFFLAWGLQRRLDDINQSIQRIMAGDLSERLAVGDSNSEIEQLAANLNFMLDRIQELMDGVKQVSDNIAHDLRTPLTRLRNQLVDLESQCNEPQQQDVRALIDEADNLLATFNALLRIARIELGESRKLREQVNLETLVRDVGELYEPLAASKEIDFRLQLAPADIYADRNLIFQAVANLVDNAIKYTPKGGAVRVELLPRATVHQQGVNEVLCHRLRIADTGCGIAAGNRDRVFQRFYREEGSRSVKPGNGLGLSLVAAVVKIHRAFIALRDNAPGLVAELDFPVYQPAPESGALLQGGPSISSSPEVSTSTAS